MGFSAKDRDLMSQLQKDYQTHARTLGDHFKGVRVFDRFSDILADMPDGKKELEQRLSALEDADNFWNKTHGRDITKGYDESTLANVASAMSDHALALRKAVYEAIGIFEKVEAKEDDRKNLKFTRIAMIAGIVAAITGVVALIDWIIRLLKGGQ